MHVFLILDIILIVTSIIYFIYKRGKKPLEDIVFESRTLPNYSVIMDIFILVTFIVLYIIFRKSEDGFEDVLDNIFGMLFFTLPIIFISLRGPKKFYITNNKFYYISIFGGFCNLGSFTDLNDHRFSKKGKLKLRFEEPDKNVRVFYIPGRFNETEINEIEKILQ